MAPLTVPRRPWWILALLPLLAGGVLLKHRSDARMARQHFEQQAADEAQAVGAKLEFTFTQIYQGLRTIARLPGVRAIDRYGEHFDVDARTSVQEIYNNLATNVAMSEVYIVPLDLDPDSIDPHTQAPGAPILTYDELIVGKSADEGAHESAEPEVEEIEIHEYRLMRTQLAWMRQHCPDESSVKGLDVPAVCGPEVVTCDNSRYSPARPDDADRSGLVYSVPFFGTDGKLKGCISGVILTHALRELLPDGSYALSCPAHDYVAGAKDPGLWQAELADVRAARGDPALPWSSVRPLGVRDEEGTWKLWAGRSPTQLADSAEMRNALLFALGGALLSLVLCGGLFFAIDGSRRHRAEVEQQNRSLESRVQQRTAELESAEKRQREAAAVDARRARELEEQVDRLLEIVARAAQGELNQHISVGGEGNVARMESGLQDLLTDLCAGVARIAETSEELARSSETCATASRRMGASAESSSASAERVSGLARELSRSMEQAAGGARELHQRFTETAQRIHEGQRIGTEAARIARQTDATVHSLGSSSSEIGKVVDVIGAISRQTNLLALNAMIEAARAGESGAGFAVVAQEVMQLARQAAQATEDIQRRIEAIRSDSTSAVRAIQEITAVIGQLHELQEALSRSIQEQVTTSAEIGSRVTSVAQSAAEIEQSITEVAEAAQTTTLGVQEVRHAADDLAQHSQALNSFVAAFRYQ